MKRIILGFTLSLISIFSHADWRDTCESMSVLASSVMGARQSGVPMSKTMKVDSGNQPLDDIAKDLVMMAYSKPKFDTEEYQQESINNFRDSVYLHCAKALRK